VKQHCFHTSIIGEKYNPRNRHLIKAYTQQRFKQSRTKPTSLRPTRLVVTDVDEWAGAGGGGIEKPNKLMP
jgi:hypothetical protein